MSPSIAGYGWYRGGRMLARRITIGLRREEKGIWECRAALSPQQVKSLIDANGQEINIVVESSPRRVFSDHEYERAGARVVATLDDAEVILGIKEIPIPQILPGKTFFCFSHTHKGQPHNLSKLTQFIKQKSTLIDYELLVDEQGRRLVAFGKFAGYAGSINCLHSIGLQLLRRGFRSPFLNVALAHSYPSLEAAKRAVTEAGATLQQNPLHSSIAPLVVTITGNGNVSQGAQEILCCLPYQMVRPADLPRLLENGGDPRIVYLVVVEASDYCRRQTMPSPFNQSDYLSNPSAYESHFHETIAPFSTAIINGIYWEEKYPRLLSTEHVKRLVADPRRRLVSIADISCDIGGSIEITSKATTIDSPFLNVEGVEVMSIDNLPTQLPRDASEYFGSRLIPILTDWIETYPKSNKIVQRATIVQAGSLAPRHQWLQQRLTRAIEPDSKKARVLVLGSGYVAGPVVKHLSGRSDVVLTVASNNAAEAQQLVASHAQQNVCDFVALDIDDRNRLSKLVSSASIVVSLVPATMHAPIAEACLANQRHLVTASYISPAMAALNGQVRDAGLLFLNEIGLDPGLDHLSAKKIIDSAHKQGHQIVSFQSWCGGLPAPECADNPLGYKFSWSPRGVLLAALNEARYLDKGQIIQIPGTALLASAISSPFPSRLNLEGLANRDSLKYVQQYGLQSSHLQTMLRGTLRYRGFSKLMGDLRNLGLFDLSQASAQTFSSCENWKQVTDILLQNYGNTQTLSAETQRAMRWLELTSSEKPFQRAATLLDSFCLLLQSKLCYSPDERDMVVMQHEFVLQRPDDSKYRIGSSLIEYGQIGGFSAMARTVGYPVAVATELLLEGSLDGLRGVCAPVDPLVYEEMLDRLARVADIRFKEVCEPLP